MLKEMGTDDDLLGIIKEAAAGGRVEFWQHARQRMNERGVDVGDVMKVLRDPKALRTAHEPNRWGVVGMDLRGDGLTVVVEVVLLEDVAVVTVF